MQCFSRYIAVIAYLLACQTLIIESQMEYQREAWMGYDHRFHQRTATNTHISWSATDSTLWNLVFAGKTKAICCSHCFSLTHKPNQCKWSSSQLPSTNHHQMSNSQPICKSWNTDRQPGCPFTDCAYNHIFWYYSADPQVTDKIHKAIFCPNHPQRRAQ